MQSRIKTKRLTLLAMYSVIALTIFMIESAIPPIVPIPGVKLGLANVVTLVLLNYCTAGEVLIVLLVRIVMGSIFGGQMLSFFYSISGGILCYLLMLGLNRFLKGRYLVIVSVGGACAHNVGQILAAYFIVKTTGVFSYLPVLMISAVVTGIFTGLVAQFAIKYLDPFWRRFASVP